MTLIVIAIVSNKMVKVLKWQMYLIKRQMFSNGDCHKMAMKSKDFM